MRVVLLTTNLARGGAEAQVAQLAAALGGGMAQVISLVRPTAHEEELASAGVPVHSLDMQPGRPDVRGLVRLARLLRNARPHVLHAHMFHANLMARMVRLICPVPVVISTIHSMAESKLAGTPASYRGRERLYRLTDCLSDATVCVSAAVAERHVAARAVSPRRVQVIPNGVDTDRFHPDPCTRERMRRELELGDEFAWLAAGRLVWKKDYPTLLRAMASQRAGILLIAGDGPLRAELEGLAAALGARVRLLGARQDLPQLMNACDAFVLSSAVEGLPMVLLEAAATGIPAVATDVGGVAEAVLHARTGLLVPPGDADTLAAAMSELAALPPEARARMAQSARDHAIARFEMHSIAAQWKDLYQQLLKPKLAADERG
jgi:glycosyltransferase involved in cell wall biosynthesis